MFCKFFEDTKYTHNSNPQKLLLIMYYVHDFRFIVKFILYYNVVYIYADAERQRERETVNSYNNFHNNANHYQRSTGSTLGKFACYG